MTTRTLAASALFCLLAATPSFAQAVRSGSTFSMGGTPYVVTPAIAYDAVHDRYLVAQGHGFIEGLLTDGNGRTLVDVIVNASRGAWAGEYAQTPAVAFAADVNNGAGGYLVTWHETIATNGTTQARGRLVSADGVPLGTDFVISTETTGVATTTNWTMPASVAYSPASHEFLVAWMGSYTTSNDIRFNRVSVTGALLQAVPTNVTNTYPDWERDPSVAYNPDADEFFVAYAGFHDAKGYAYVGGQRVKAGTGQTLGGRLEFDQTLATYIPSVTYNTISRQYLLVWYHRTTGAPAFYGIKLNADGSAASQLIVESSFYTAYDALDVKFNSGSGDYLLVTHSGGAEDAAVSITSAGTPYDNGFIATATSDTGNFNPRIAPNPARRNWLLVTSGGFVSVLGQFIQSQNTAPSGPSTPSTPSAPTPKPMVFVDTPRPSAVVGTNGFAIAGWAADMGATSGTGIDAVAVWALPSTGASAILAGVATYGNAYGSARPDVGAYLGSQFTNTGYGLTATLPAGTYTLAVYAHSTVNNSWNTPALVNVTVQPPQSRPLMWVDAPAQNQTISQNVFVGGWAVDTASSSGPGVDAVHVWAYPQGSSTAVFVGASTTGVSRPDVGAVFGSQFSTAGFNVTGTLAQGVYTLVVFAHSSVTGTFNDVRTVSVTVR